MFTGETTYKELLYEVLGSTMTPENCLLKYDVSIALFKNDNTSSEIFGSTCQYVSYTLALLLVQVRVFALRS
jgi:hypothetical protein